jgi:acetyl-CoA C-acetyltransferase
MHPHTPVLVGVGLVMQREDDPLQAREPLALMIDAARAAGDDCGARELLAEIARIAVPVGRWRYRNPGRLIGEAVGAARATSISALPGVSQQTLLSDACSAIARGEVGAAMVIGGEAGYRLQCAKRHGIRVSDTASTDLPDIEMTPQDDMLPDYEQATGLGPMPVGYYAIVDSAFRHARGFTTDAYRDRIADRYSRFSDVAAENPHAWLRRHVEAAAIRDGSAANPMLAFPYTKLHNSQWNVDQASALLFCSADKAQALGIPRDRWVFPQVFTEANHMVNITARGALDRCVGAELAGKAAFAKAACAPDELDFLELYSCFPVAVESYAHELGIPASIDWTITGGMPFAGGPFNSFVLHTVGQMAERIRAQPHSRGMVTTVSGIITKQGFGIWGTDPNPHGYEFVDVTPEVIAATEVREVLPDYHGPATVAGYTVVYDRSGAHRGVAVVDLPDGKRSIASTDDPDLMSRMATTEFCGVALDVRAGLFTVRA